MELCLEVLGIPGVELFEYRTLMGWFDDTLDYFGVVIRMVRWSSSYLSSRLLVVILGIFWDRELPSFPQERDEGVNGIQGVWRKISIHVLKAGVWLVYLYMGLATTIFAIHLAHILAFELILHCVLRNVWSYLLVTVVKYSETSSCSSTWVFIKTDNGYLKLVYSAMKSMK